MAQWSRTDKTLYAKIVYYGPAFGGKTTNLEALHRITDPQGRQKLLSVKTADDRTLFFDLLPFDMGDILGYRVAMKLYTVPGQVRYDTTRQIVLAGADAVVFVADSSPGRLEQSRWALQNLQMNMRARRLDSSVVPVVYQFNKQDVEGASSPEELACALGGKPSPCFPAVATEGQGVLETFVETARMMLKRLVAQADERTRREIDTKELDVQIDTCFAPYLARSAGQADSTGARTDEVVLRNDDLLEDSIEAGTKLGERLSAEAARAIRLERQAQALRAISDSLRRVGASFDQESIVDAALQSVREILDAPVVCLVSHGADGKPRLEQAHGADRDPLTSFPSGNCLLERMMTMDRPCVVGDIAAECSGKLPPEVAESLRAVVAVPVEAEDGRTLIAYAPQPDGLFDQQDIRFLVTVAGHLAVGLEKSRHYAERENPDARPERQARHARGRCLAGLSREMKKPLNAILDSSLSLRDGSHAARVQERLVQSIVHSAETLQELMESLSRATDARSDPEPPDWQETSTSVLIEEAIALAGGEAGSIGVPRRDIRLQADRPRLVQALANLIENAVKFSGEPVEVVVKKGRLRRDGHAVAGLSISVLDRGPGLAEADRERMFQPFEQGGDPASDLAGAGLGLHEARTIARLHGGQLACLAREGGGCEMRLSLPLSPAPKPAAERELVGA